jgi:hypothetical protein
MTTANPSIAKLRAAIATPEADVPVPSRENIGSLTSQIANLPVGECVSKARRVPGNLTLSTYADSAIEANEKLRSSVGSCVRSAKERSGGEYTIEIGDLLTTQRSLYLVAVITRTA